MRHISQIWYSVICWLKAEAFRLISQVTFLEVSRWINIKKVKFTFACWTYFSFGATYQRHRKWPWGTPSVHFLAGKLTTWLLQTEDCTTRNLPLFAAGFCYDHGWDHGDRGKLLAHTAEDQLHVNACQQRIHGVNGILVVMDPGANGWWGKVCGRGVGVGWGLMGHVEVGLRAMSLEWVVGWGRGWGMGVVGVWGGFCLWKSPPPTPHPPTHPPTHTHIHTHTHGWQGQIEIPKSPWRSAWAIFMTPVKPFPTVHGAFTDNLAKWMPAERVISLHF